MVLVVGAVTVEKLVGVVEDGLNVGKLVGGCGGAQLWINKRYDCT